MVKPYRVELRLEARDGLARLDESNAQRILNRVKWLCENFDAVRHEALKGEFKGLFKLYVGDYRVIYSSDRTTWLVTVHLIDHRRSIYKRR